jgi:L-lactate dehydrogenase complex protein LldF
LKAASQAPYHPVYHTLNFSKEEINGVLNEHYKLKLGSTSKQMISFIRYQINQDLKKIDICITGANFLLSDVGGVVLVENEGNILKSCTSAKIHIVVAGIDKVISSVEDLSIVLPLLSSYANGNGMTAVNSITVGPSKNRQGPEQMYVILLDNNRTNILENEVIRQSLSCIHCGACISVCPIYKNIGGNTYNTPYIGPIGSVMAPLMFGLEEYQHLASLCSLCGRCTEVCPVKIPIENLIIENRRLITEKRVGNAKYEALVKSMISHCKSRKKMDCPQWLKKFEVKQLVSKSAFTKRTMPDLAPKSFNQLSKEE